LTWATPRPAATTSFRATSADARCRAALPAAAHPRAGRPETRFASQDPPAAHQPAVAGAPGARRAANRLQHAPRPRHLLRARREAFVDDRHLLRMDAELAAEAEAPRPQRIGTQRRRIVERGRDSIDGRRNAGEPRSEHEHRTEVVQL